MPIHESNFGSGIVVVFANVELQLKAGLTFRHVIMPIHTSPYEPSSSGAERMGRRSPALLTRPTPSFKTRGAPASYMSCEITDGSTLFTTTTQTPRYQRLCQLSHIQGTV